MTTSNATHKPSLPLWRAVVDDATSCNALYGLVLKANERRMFSRNVEPSRACQSRLHALRNLLFKRSTLLNYSTMTLVRWGEVASPRTIAYSGTNMRSTTVENFVTIFEIISRIPKIPSHFSVSRPEPLKGTFVLLCEIQKINLST